MTACADLWYRIRNAVWDVMIAIGDAVPESWRRIVLFFDSRPRLLLAMSIAGAVATVVIWAVPA